MEIEYRVAQQIARAFHNVMQKIELSRRGNGAYGWSIGVPNCGPNAIAVRHGLTIRQRNRSPHSERELDRQATIFHVGPDPIRVRCTLECPFGLVRWKEEPRMMPSRLIASAA
ncbi:MFS transporter [Bradyrhizobium uaiense]|uniref:MFS transporter n=1 Tax=Bradyrhizobium uaiense TaxID=2594946 RepID=UPI003D319ACF